MAIHLLTYGDHNFEGSKQLLRAEAEQWGIFASIDTLSPSDLSPEFRQEFAEVLSRPRGGGYCIWKAEIIKRKLERVPDGDFVIYLDAGCGINPGGAQRLQEYLEMLNRSDYGVISFQMGHHQERWWTTKEVFDYFSTEPDGPHGMSGQLVAGLFITQNCYHAHLIFDRILQTYHEAPLIVTDQFNDKQAPYFRDHRHDQSISSLVRKIYGSIVLPDETWYEDFRCEQARRIPFLAIRRKVANKL